MHTAEHVQCTVQWRTHAHGRTRAMYSAVDRTHAHGRTRAVYSAVDRTHAPGRTRAVYSAVDRTLARSTRSVDIFNWDTYGIDNQ